MGSFLSTARVHNNVDQTVATHPNKYCLRRRTTRRRRRIRITRTLHCHRPWADLHVDILGLFLDRLGFADHARFAAVCTSWHSVAVEHPHYQALHNLPWLVIPSRGLTWRLSIPGEQQLHHHRHFWVRHGTRCIGASHGWLIISNNGDYCLQNPVTNRKIDLPYSPVEFSPKYFGKAIMSSAPTTSNIAAGNCMVVTRDNIFKKLWFCWPRVSKIWFPAVLIHESFNDYIFSNGLLYCLSYREEIFVCKLMPQPTVIQIHRPTRANLDPYRPKPSYLVESPGELMMVVKHRERHKEDSNAPPGSDDDSDYGVNCNCTRYKPTRFEVYKLDLSHLEWSKITSLGDRTLFLGLSGSRSISVAARNSKFRQNCIYFTEDLDITEYSLPHGLDWGVFCLEDESTARAIYPDHSHSADRVKTPASPPLWLMLNV